MRSLWFTSDNGPELATGLPPPGYDGMRVGIVRWTYIRAGVLRVCEL